MINCKNCDGGYTLAQYPTEYVSHDMAIDAGFPYMGGSVYSTKEDYEICSCCNGNWEDCKFCKEQELSDNF